MRNTILYAGYERTEFETLMADAAEENDANLKLYALITTLLFVGLFVANVIVRPARILNIPVYGAMALINLGIYLATVYWAPRNRQVAMPLTYVYTGALYLFSLSVTTAHLEYPAVTAIAVMLLIPFLFTGKPVYSITQTFLCVALLCLLSWKYKERDIATMDVWNAISFGAVSVVAELLHLRLKLRVFAQARHIAYLSQTDLLTGAKNRNCYETLLEEADDAISLPRICVYVDVNGLHELNDSQGHKAGDVMLQTVAAALIEGFGQENTFRIGGDEFVIFRDDLEEAAASEKLRSISKRLSERHYDISCGVASAGEALNTMSALIAEAEARMYREKSSYYQQPGHERRRR